MLAVGAVSCDLRRAKFSNTGTHIGACAPGVHILSTLPMKRSAARQETEYAAWDGTSMATPHVAGAAALYCGLNSAASAMDVKAAITKACRKVPEMGSKGFTPSFGSGIIDLTKLLS
ncbi:MAG: S8 family serine peptidase [Acidobacteriota bacterium]